MRTGWNWMRIVVLLLVLAFVAISLALAAAWSSLPLDQTTISIDNETFHLSALQGWPAAGVIVGGALAILLLLIVATCLVAFALCVAVLAVLAGLAAAVGTLALVLSPVILAVWVIWLLLRPRRDLPPVAAA